jgi:hypothetical protein
MLSGNWPINIQTLVVQADFNGDFVVDVNDLNVIANNAGATSATWAQGDLDGDGEVTMDDLDLAFAQYGAGGLFLSVVS